MGTSSYPTAGGIYAGRTMGNGQPVPGVSQGGAPDINAIVGGMVDRGKWYYYDTLKLAPGATVQNQYSFFASAMGQADPYTTATPVKTKLETNLPTANQFNPPFDMILNNLGFYFLQDGRAYDMEQIFKHAYIEFKIIDKIFFEGHMWRHPPGAGFSGMSTQTAESMWNNGIPDPGACYTFGNWAKYIPPLVRFTLTISFPETFNQMYGTSILTAQQTVAGQSSTTLPTLLTTAQGGNGIWLVAFMNGLTDRAVQ